MHGRRRDEYKARLADPKMAAAMERKAQQWNTLSKLVQEELPDQALTEKLLLVNPDPLVLWNKRRKQLLVQESIKWETELVLTASCLERNPKAYGPWFHRKWCLSKQVDTIQDKNRLLQKELDLCAQFLKLDERNFHCWNYRRFVVGLLLGEALDGSWSDGNAMGAQIVTVRLAIASVSTITTRTSKP